MHIYDPDRFGFARSPRLAPSRAAVSQYQNVAEAVGTTARDAAFLLGPVIRVAMHFALGITANMNDLAALS